MTISLGADAITLSGPCGVEEVETLITYMQSRPDLSVDLSAATALHTALWQALMVFRPKITGMPTSSSVSEKFLSGLNSYFDETRKA